VLQRVVLIVDAAIKERVLEAVEAGLDDVLESP
jgi:hypothetical protein